MKRHAAALCALAATVLSCNQAPKEPIRRAGSPALRLPGLDRVFGTHLPQFIIDLNDESDQIAARLDDGRSAIAKSCAGSPEAICNRLDALVVALLAAHIAHPATLDLLSTSLAQSKRQLNRSLAANDAAYFVDTSLLELDGKRVVLAFSFQVEDTKHYRAGKLTIPVLMLRRLDRLNWRYELLGFADELESEAAVLLDVVDTDLKTDEPTTESSMIRLWHAILATEAGRDNELAALRAVHAHRIAVHEAQHRVDSKLGLPLPKSDVAMEGESPIDRDLFNAELSAYLAEMVHAPRTARSSLARLLHFAVSEELSGSVEAQVAAFIVRRIGARMGLENPNELLKVALRRPIEGDIAAAARAEWQSLYGRELVEISGPH